MIHGVTSVENLVYHYTTAETANDHILRNKTLKLGTYAKTNDPKETKAWQFSLGTNENRDLGAYRFKETGEHFSAALKEHAKLCCFSMDTAPLTGDHVKDILHRGYAKPRMWAQYGRMHALTSKCITGRSFSRNYSIGAMKANGGSCCSARLVPTSMFNTARLLSA